MVVKFAFEKAEKNFFGSVFRPIVKVSFKSLIGNFWIDTWMVVDSGADFTLLPAYLCNDLKISFEHDCIKDTTAGVGGEQTVYLCNKKIKVRLGLFEREIPLAFLDSNEVPALLGRQGFLETFDTQFLKNNFVIFKS